MARANRFEIKIETVNQSEIEKSGCICPNPLGIWCLENIPYWRLYFEYIKALHSSKIIGAQSEGKSKLISDFFLCLCIFLFIFKQVPSAICTPFPTLKWTWKTFQNESNTMFQAKKENIFTFFCHSMDE